MHFLFHVLSGFSRWTGSRWKKGKTGGEQSLFDNLRLDIGGELDVKVTDLLYTGEEDKRVLTLTFTALPENFSEWKRNLMP